MTTTTKPVRIEKSTVAKLDQLKKQIEEDTGIDCVTYSQVIEHLIKKAKKK